MKSVYIETSIPSFYFETRPEPEMIARRNWTREWWDHQQHFYQLSTSEAVFNELDEGEYPTKQAALGLLAPIQRLALTDDIVQIVEVYIENHLMPKSRVGDALHLALASFHKCDFLLTWNCTHIANANKFQHIRVINSRLGLFVPTLITPIELYQEKLS